MVVCFYYFVAVIVDSIFYLQNHVHSACQVMIRMMNVHGMHLD